MRDTITTDDLLIPGERTHIEHELAQALQEKAVLEERLHLMEEQMQDILRAVRHLSGRS